METLEQIILFMHKIEKLKYELRHGWTSTGRQESVADHCWRTALLVLVCAPFMNRKIDLKKTIEMALIHDLGEAIIGDEHYLNIHNNKGKKAKRFKKERAAFQQLSSMLGSSGEFLLKLWEEFEENKTYEAKVVHTFDKLEACLQLNEADFSTWSKEEIEDLPFYFERIEDCDNFLTSLKTAICKETMNKLAKNTASRSSN